MEENKGKSLKKELYEWVSVGLGALVITVLIFTFVFRVVGVDGTSMVPTLASNDRLVLWQVGYRPTNGDVVVVTKPNSENVPLIKRVIATEGQTIDINFETGDITVDGKVLTEPYIKERTNRSYDVKFPQTVPEGCVFVMGDNRNASWDSRDSRIGMIDERYVLGKALFRIFPLKKIGPIR